MWNQICKTVIVGANVEYVGEFECYFSFQLHLYAAIYVHIVSNIHSQLLLFASIDIEFLYSMISTEVGEYWLFRVRVWVRVLTIRVRVWVRVPTARVWVRVRVPTARVSVRVLALQVRIWVRPRLCRSSNKSLNAFDYKTHAFCCRIKHWLAIVYWKIT